MKEEKKQIMSKTFKILYWFIVLPAIIPGIASIFSIVKLTMFGFLKPMSIFFSIIISFYLFKKALKNNNKIAYFILFLLLIFLIIISSMVFANFWGHVNIAFAGIWGLFIIAGPFYYGITAIFWALEFYRYLRKDKNQANQV